MRQTLAEHGFDPETALLAEEPDCPNGIYEVDEHFRIVAYTASAKRRYPQLTRGQSCYRCLMGQETPCANCPVLAKGEGSNPLLDMEPVTTENGEAYLLRFKSGALGPERSVIHFEDEEEMAMWESGEIRGDIVPAYYCGPKEALPDSHSQIMEDLLKANFGVGMVAGFYDEEMSIQFINNLALSILQYPSYTTFKRLTGNKMLSTLQNGQSREDVVRMMEACSGMRISWTMKGYGGATVFTDVGSKTVVTKDGRKVWYTAIRSADDKQFDLITGGYSRMGFINHVEQMCTDGVDLSKYIIMYLNIDKFKSINELFTIAGGDNLLRIVYMMIAHSALKPVLCGRMESDHLVALFDAENLESADLRQLQSIQWTYGGRTINVRARCGLYRIEDSEMAVSGMIDRAKLAKQYIADEYIRPYAMYDRSMQDEYILQAEVGAEFGQALQEEQFKVFYQPIVDAVSGRVVSAEALIRWHHPQKGLISPALFLPTLEANGAISRVDEYVNDRVYRFAERRLAEKRFFVPVSVNLSWMDFYENGFMQRIMQNANSTCLPQGSVRYEITETSYAALEGNGTDILERLRSQGVQILLDDFGSGMSSFGMLQKYEFDILKLDMSFVRQIGKNEKTQTIIDVIVDMCHRLGIKVVAEGAETLEQVSFLRKIRCDCIQGYFFSKPLDEDTFAAYLDEQEKLQ